MEMCTHFRRTIQIGVWITLVLGWVSVCGEVPHSINYQGRLVDDAGVPIDTTVDVTFRLYDDRYTGTMIWEQMHGSVLVEDGLFTANLSSFGGIASIFDGTERWLTVQIGDGLESDPRLRLTSVAYAYRSELADTAAYALASAGGSSNWTFTDNVLYPSGPYGIAGYSGTLIGSDKSGMVCLGQANTTGSSTTDAQLATVGGGGSNEARGSLTTVSGGSQNIAHNWASTVSGGFNNQAEGTSATVGGGSNNYAIGLGAVIAGGTRSIASGEYSGILGGDTNTVSGNYSASLGGRLNIIEASNSFILGGYRDTISAGADYSYLFGIGSNLTTDSTFMVDMPHIRFGDEQMGYEFPPADGSADQVMTTDGAGQLAWTDVPAGGISQTEADELYVNESGDTLTAGLTFDAAADGTVEARIIAADSYANLELLDNGQLSAKLWGDTWGELELADDDGDVTAVLDATNSSGGNLWLRDRTGNPRIRLNAEGVGSSSAQLQPDAIDRDEILDETGLARAMTMGSISLGVAMTDILVSSITIPAPGYIYATARCNLRLWGTCHARGATIQIDEDAGGDPIAGIYAWAFQDSSVSITGDYMPVFVDRVYYKSTDGTYTFRMEGRYEESGGTATAVDPQLTLIYIPTSYSAVKTQTYDPGDNPEARPVTAHAGDDLPGASEQLYEVDLRYYELRAKEARLQAKQAELEASEAERKLIEARLREERHN